ncbi:hypothetical protein E5676_scaffold304G00120 [Cucumis melo var. makuwa]|uniref:Uncharacterized protein n=1 Tax=Cucumis melo var. makuwa TaxID=1194695 RepID=A0A5D3CIG5_CUCMM|nr:hypothetical protein E5676_scaffold304G00120 [Cucumis melo var. makuwa]
MSNSSSYCSTVILLYRHLALLQVQELLLLRVLHVRRKELSIEALLEVLPGYLADISTQHPLSSLPPLGASILQEENCALNLLVIMAFHVPANLLYRGQPHLGLVGPTRAELPRGWKRGGLGLLGSMKRQGYNHNISKVLNIPAEAKDPYGSPRSLLVARQLDCLSVSFGYTTDQIFLGISLGSPKTSYVPPGSHVARVREHASSWIPLSGL